MFPMQNFEPESAVISAASNSALIEKYLRNTCLGQGAVLMFFYYLNYKQAHLVCSTHVLSCMCVLFPKQSQNK